MPETHKGASNLFNPSRKIFSARLKQRLSDTGTSQIRLGELLQMPRQNVSNWFHGSSLPQLSRILPVCPASLQGWLPALKCASRRSCGRSLQPKVVLLEFGSAGLKRGIAWLCDTGGCKEGSLCHCWGVRRQRNGFPLELWTCA